MSAFDKFKNKKSSLKQTIEASTKATYKRDEFYMPEPDKEGTGDAIIRFLPQKDVDKSVFVNVYQHIFKGDNGVWIYTLCPTTFGKGEKCECCRRNGILYNTNIPELRNVVSIRKRSHKYICNIVVIKDPQNPSNEGKVFPFQFGNAIFNKINDALNPKFAGDESVDVFDIFEGADFHLRFSKDKQKNQRTYDASYFDKPSVLYNGDAKKLDEVFEQLVDLDKFISKERAYTPDVMLDKCRLAYSSFATYFPEDMVGATKTYGRTASASPAFESAPAVNKTVSAPEPEVEDNPWGDSSGFGGSEDTAEESEALAYFQSVANRS